MTSLKQKECKSIIQCSIMCQLKKFKMFKLTLIAVSDSWLSSAHKYAHVKFFFALSAYYCMGNEMQTIQNDNTRALWIQTTQYGWCVCVYNCESPHCRQNLHKQHVLYIQMCFFSQCARCERKTRTNVHVNETNEQKTRIIITRTRPSADDSGSKLEGKRASEREIKNVACLLGHSVKTDGCKLVACGRRICLLFDCYHTVCNILGVLTCTEIA